jgi:fructan beta-fructosidase
MSRGPIVLLLLALGASAPRTDVVVADFEGDDYGDWKTTGTAFGKGPVRGTLPGQMPVTGFKGRGLVNSFHGGDASTGTLTSPEFTISRRYLSFLIGGGHHPGKACINLLVGGKVVRTATGPNKQPGGTERLDPHGWDLADLAGKKAVIEIVDRVTGGWGHINIDHIVLTDAKPPLTLFGATRTITATKRYLELPVRTGDPKRRVRLSAGDSTFREFEIELAEAKPSFRAVVDLGPVRGKKVTIHVDQVREGAPGWEGIAQVDEPSDAGVYREAHRPGFHFTARRGWLNDPNGLVYHRGEWHLYFQHNPYGWGWGNMHWGHATSPDLFRWKEQPTALYPRQFGDWCFSGSAVVDRANTSGLKKGGEDVLVAAFTSTGRGECIVFSNDRGRTWQEIAGNPVVKHAGRDPRLLWHAPTKHWVMAVYDEHQGKQWIALHTSADLKKWTFQSRIEGFFECPDLFELPVEGDAKEMRWVLYGADGKYLLGSFDGKAFTKESGKHQLWHGNFYAAQTFSDAPDGRRVQIGWASGISFPGMPFNQQMTVPCELHLLRTAEGLRMTAWPVKEFAGLRKRKHAWKELAVKVGSTVLPGVKGPLLDLSAEVRPGDAAEVEFTVCGVPVVYDVKKQQVSCRGKSAPLRLIGGVVRLRVLVDRGSVEVFGNGGAVALSAGGLLGAKDRVVGVFARGGDARLANLEVHELRSAWE